jgi:CBS domain-containing protein
MSTEVVSARESDALAGLLATMRRKGLRRLPVLDDRGTLVGLVTLDDLLSIIAEQLRAVVQAIDSEQRRERRVRR